MMRTRACLMAMRLGATGQLQWLKDGLLASTAVWKIIFSSVVTNTSTKFPDGWAGYQTEWLALKAVYQLEQHSKRCFHFGRPASGFDRQWQPGRLSRNVRAPGQRFCAAGYCAQLASVGDWSEGYYDDSCSGFALVTISQNPDRLTLQTADEYGTVHLSYEIAAAQPTPTPTQPQLQRHSQPQPTTHRHSNPDRDANTNRHLLPLQPTPPTPTPLQHLPQPDADSYSDPTRPSPALDHNAAGQ